MKKALGMAVFFAVLCVLLMLTTDKFATPENLQQVARRSPLIGLLAIGEGLVIVGGGIDLSVGSILAISGLVVVQLTRFQDVPVLVAVPAAIALGTFIGWLNGVVVTRFKLQPFIVTLCSMLIVRSVGRAVVEDASQSFADQFEGLRQLGTGYWLGVPVSGWCLLAVAVVMALIMHVTIFGRYLYAVGRNPEAARFSGVRVERMQLLSYTISGALAGFTGVIYACYVNDVEPTSAGLMFELYAIAAAVIGGCSLRGGEGTVLGMVIGTGIIQVIRNSIILLGIHDYWNDGVVGGVILLGALLDETVRRRTEDLALRRKEQPAAPDRARAPTAAPPQAPRA